MNTQILKQAIHENYHPQNAIFACKNNHEN